MIIFIFLKIYFSVGFNAEISYTVVHGSDIVTLQEPKSSQGKISTNSMLGTAVILVRFQEMVNNEHVQELSVVIQVKPVSYLMLNALPVFTSWWRQGTLKNWPLGLKLPISVSFHDEYGVKFDAVHKENAIITRPNR